MDETTVLKKFDKLAHKTAKFYFERSGGRHEYEDLYQAARLGIVSAARTFNPELGVELITHVWNCARNSAKKHIRDNSGLIRIPQTASESDYVTVVDSEIGDKLMETKASRDDMSVSENSIVLSEALDKIPEKQREAIRLIYFSGFTFEEAAVSLNVSKQNVNQLTIRGLEKLREIIGEMPQIA